MNTIFELDRAARELYDVQGRRLDAVTRTWTFVRSAEKSAQCERVDALAAVNWLQRESGHPLRIPIGVIGPREAKPAQLAAALRVGGVSIGLLPDADAAHANPFVSVALATGIGEARNALIARASLCLVAVGDSLGTLSEVALGRHFGKLVIGLEGAAQVDGVVHVESPQAAVELVAGVALNR